ncbi:SpoVR family protein [Paenibacillus alkalitolerans]|uniref:SpoVR family protein n=1 Tax=Paenibacillus alkalitolerans TaxID=2799335 RepID=UPI0018F771E5|nr:SpoVR family protein [Paenibacillus alkalitolerans]
MDSREIKALESAIAEITDVARSFGLDFYPMRYEICPADIIYTFGAYGMPTRFSHWSFGKTFHRMKTHYDLGLSKIYELVINSDPCYAFLLEGNSLIQNKLIVAHVLAHCDFFKNNAHFSRTNRDMVERMASTAERIRQYEMDYGTDNVERFLDAALSIQENVDPGKFRTERFLMPKEQEHSQSQKRRTAPLSPYDDLWQMDAEAAAGGANETPEKRKFPPKPEKDLVWFIERYARDMEEWQRDILSVLHEEMLYFWPQIETKIMNEGWASYWHTRIMRELDLTPEETIEYSKLNSSVVVPSRVTLNPYYLGFKIFEDIEKRYGRDHMFEVRELDNDVSFLRNFLTKELVEDLDLFVFERKGQEWVVTDNAWENVRNQLAASRINGGIPVIYVQDGDYLRNGELYLKHAYEGVELDMKHLERTLPNVFELWQRTVHMETVVEGKSIVFTYDGKKHHRRFL